MEIKEVNRDQDLACANQAAGHQNRRTENFRSLFDQEHSISTMPSRRLYGNLEFTWDRATGTVAPGIMSIHHYVIDLPSVSVPVHSGRLFSQGPRGLHVHGRRTASMSDQGNHTLHRRRRGM
jgi:hypothetical protein